MKTLLLLLRDRSVVSAVVSAVSAVICALFAGCKLACAELRLKDFSAEVVLPYMVNSSTNSMENVK